MHPPQRDTPDALGFYRWLRDTAESPLHRGTLHALLPDRMPLGTLEDDLHTLRRRLVCRWCRRAFRMCDSIGQWRCSFHPGGLGAGEYTCCGAPAGDELGAGCTPCDHESDVDPVALRARDHAEGRTLAAVHAARAALRRRHRAVGGDGQAAHDDEDDAAPLDARTYAAALRNLAAREAHLSIHAAAAALALPPTAATGTALQRAGPGTLLLRTPHADGRVTSEAYYAPDELRAGAGPSGELQRLRADVLRGATLTTHASAAQVRVPLYLLITRALEWPREDAIADYVPAARTDGRPGICALRSHIAVHTRASRPVARRR